MTFGLATEDITHINAVFAAHPAVRQVIIFGSRALDTYKPGSDIDMTIIGDNLTYSDILELHSELEQLGLLNQFDLQRFDAIKDPAVLDHIKRVGRPFYNRQ